MSKYLAILAADDTDKSNGLNILLSSINEYYPECFEDWNCFILTPIQFKSSEIKLIELSRKLNYLTIESGYFSSIYMYKTILRKFVEDYCNDEDKILYLDYDHICISKFNLPEIHKNEIYVSSETKAINDSFLQISALKNINCRQLTHFNTSLIYSNAEYLLKATEKWISFCVLLEQSINIKEVEEIAFSCSSQNAGFTLKPISNKIQSNWSDLSKASLFHYGGETMLAKGMKKLLFQNRMSIAEVDLTFKPEFKSNLEKDYFNLIMKFFQEL